MRQRQNSAPNKLYQAVPLEPVELVVKDCRNIIRQRQLLSEHVYKILLEQIQEDLENRISMMREKRSTNHNQFLLLKKKRKEGFVNKNQEIFFFKEFFEEQLTINGQKMVLPFSKYEKIKKLLDDKTEMVTKMRYMINLMKKYQDYLNNSLKDMTKDLVYQTKMAIIYRKKAKKLESQLDKLEKSKNKKSKISVGGFFNKSKKKKKSAIN